MPLLEAILSFILVIFAISVAVTLILAVWFDFWNIKQKRLHAMLRGFYVMSLAPYVNTYFNESSLLSTGEEDQKRFLWVMASKTEEPTEEDILKDPGFLKDLTEIDADFFETNFKNSVFGKTVMDEFGKKNISWDDPEGISFLNHLKSKFHAAEVKATNSFRQYARICSFFVAAGVVTLANVDSIALVKDFVTDPAKRSIVLGKEVELSAQLKSLSAQIKSSGIDKATANKLATKRKELKELLVNSEGKKLVKEYLDNSNKILTADLKSKIISKNSAEANKAIKNLENWKEVNSEKEFVLKFIKNQNEKLIFSLNSNALDDLATEKRALEMAIDNSKGVERLNTFLADTQKIEKDYLTVYEKNSESLQKLIKRFDDFDYPMGWKNRFPLCEDCGKDIIDFVFWVLGLFLTAGLVSLGAPFWKDILKSIGSARKTFKEAASS